MAPSRTCRCQSSGLRMVRRVVMTYALTLLLPCPLKRASTSYFRDLLEDVDGRDNKPGHDVRDCQPIGAAAASSVGIGFSKIIPPVRSATRVKPRLAHHCSRPSMIAIMPDGLRNVK